MIRKATVAGRFYPGSKESIISQIESFDFDDKEPVEAFGVVAPHAGYQYSGPVAAKVYARLKIRGSVILIGPNHGSGRGSDAPPVAIMSEGSWELPTGEVCIDGELAKILMEEAPVITEAGWAHEAEHSLEVQIPFLQRFAGDVSNAPPIMIDPIIMARLARDQVIELADGIFRAVEKYGKPVTFVASTDFSHYVPHKTAHELDHMAIKKIEALDGPGLLDVVSKNQISMCGVQPTAVVIEVCKRLGAKKAELVSYQTSGDITGDFSSVVGYGGLLIV
ncbi:Candidate phosphomevalonate decarboxylase; COG1355, Predicted dioxygenase [hydrothermal vent metagenome]|uniref:Candidate phosphomevalonate decarboxylase COG1355, Predicted dioxygenase n=1 Tax=hydrothermal vent metagenome TaxID=652676 RepID=A0A3B1CUH8_9ZZZZ